MPFKEDIEKYLISTSEEISYIFYTKIECQGGEKGNIREQSENIDFVCKT